jgi:NADH:ubiquinone oxidoreductase subunit 3 (subunit A)
VIDRKDWLKRNSNNMKQLLYESSNLRKRITHKEELNENDYLLVFLFIFAIIIILLFVVYLFRNKQKFFKFFLKSKKNPLDGFNR